MTGPEIAPKPMVQHGAYPGLATNVQRLERTPSNDRYARETPADRIFGHQMGG
jgi:hypothetical protein